MRQDPKSRTDSVLAEITKRFAEFNAAKPLARGRRFPEDLLPLVQQALTAGVKPAALHKATGVSRATIERWVKAWASSPRKIAARARQLEVVNERQTTDAPRREARSSAAAVVIRLPSGIAIELPTSAVLDRALLLTLAQLGGEGGSHAAAR